ncbi:universal stress protein [Sporichthya polymorpha]|uniref:universal stress protein n=1 Tax=Sporichthya polymorpha TaxID=35751 RepID=UPI00036AF295|nr:universal stress protein [Sporichthya polymorpha]
MNAPRLITVGVDGSAGGRRALEWAVHLAAATGATVEVVTAWSWDGMAFSPGMTAGPDQERNYLAERQELDVDAVLKDLDGPAPTIAKRLVEGSPTKVLIEAARNADLLVLGSHGRSHLHNALLGSVSESCVRHGSTPVVVVPAHDRSAHPGEALVQA